MKKIVSTAVTAVTVFLLIFDCGIAPVNSDKGKTQFQSYNDDSHNNESVEVFREEMFFKFFRDLSVRRKLSPILIKWLWFFSC